MENPKDDRRVLGEDRIGSLLAFERNIRRAEDQIALYYSIVNQAQSLFPYGQAILLLGNEKKSLKVVSISNQSGVDRKSQFVAWVEHLAMHLRSEYGCMVRQFTQNDIGKNGSEEWSEYSPGYGLYLPLADPVNGPQGVLILFRDQSWKLQDGDIFHYVGELLGHCLHSRIAGSAYLQLFSSLFSRKKLIALIMLTGMLGFIPVNLSVLAPAKVAARDPEILSAPINGVVSRIEVAPDQLVRAGDILIRFDDSDLLNTLNIAERKLELARVHLHKVEQSGFVDHKWKGDLAEAQAELDLRTAEYEYARLELEKSSMKAKSDGIVLVDQPSKWEGKPVRIGEKILSIAKSDEVELEIMLPVKDAISLNPGTKIRFYSDIDPLKPFELTLKRSSFDPEFTEDRILSFRIIADFGRDEKPLRIGLRGTAKLYGDQVSLCFAVFRRPVTALRQRLGL